MAFIIKGGFFHRSPGKVTYLSGGTVTPPAPGTCVLTTRSHNTGATIAQHQPSNDDLANNYGALPGTTWSTQISRWTTKYNTDVNEYAIEPGPIQFLLDKTPLTLSQGATTVNDLVAQINTVPGWVGKINYGDSATYGANGDPVLVVAYTGGVQKSGLRVAYAQDSTGDLTSHPAVEVLFNGSWRHGNPCDGNCRPLESVAYSTIMRSFPGGVSLTTAPDVVGPATTANTLGSSPNMAGHALPGLITSYTVLATDPISKLGLDPTTHSEFDIALVDGDGGTNTASFSASSTSQTVQDFIDAINEDTIVHGAVALIDATGHLVILNTKAGAPAGLAAFDLADSENVDTVFGAQPQTTTYYQWMFLSSRSTFDLTTPLQQFFPNGPFEFGIDPGYPSNPVSVGTTDNLSTVGDLIAAINALNSGTTALAYLENGHLIVALKDISNQPDTTILVGRYFDNPHPWREPGEMLYGAGTVRNGLYTFTANDVSANATSTGALTASFFTGSIPTRPRYATLPTPAVKLSTRSITADTRLSDFYPIGFLISINHANFGQQWNDGIEITATNTIADAYNYWGQRFATFRLVDANGNPQSYAGFLRSTSVSDALVNLWWYDSYSQLKGEATRFFVDAGEGSGYPPGTERPTTGGGNTGGNTGGGNTGGGNTGGGDTGGGDTGGGNTGNQIPPNYQTSGTTKQQLPASTNSTSTQSTDANGNQTLVYSPGTYTPATGVPAANFPGSNPTPTTAHKFWRINISAVQQAGLQPALSWIAMYDNQKNSVLQYDSSGNPTNGVAIASSGNAPTAFYTAPSVSFPGWKATTQDAAWVGFQFNAPVAVARIAYQAYINEYTPSPRNFTVEWSDDGQNWTVANTYVDMLSAYNHRFRTAITDASTCPVQNVNITPAAYPMPAGLTAAYALRVIVPGYTGPLIAVETDLYGTVDVYPMSDGSLDVGYLQAIMNANGAIGVSKWYDQSGNGRTAIVVSVAACPLIIEGGVATTSVNGRPGLHMYPNSPFNLPFGPLQAGVTFQSVFMNVDSNNWPTILANQLTDGSTASIGVNRNTRVLSLFRNGQADSPSALTTSLGTTAILSCTWFQGGDYTATGGFSLNGTQSNPITLNYYAPANSRGRIGQSFQVANDLGGDSISNGYISEALFYPQSGADTTGSLTDLSNFFGIPLAGGYQPDQPPAGAPNPNYNYDFRYDAPPMAG